jgi:hypothetical protein
MDETKEDANASIAVSGPGRGDHRGATEEPAAAHGHLRWGRASHGLIARLDALASRPGHQLAYSIGWVLGARERE